jgi:hypothetical protein
MAVADNPSGSDPICLEEPHPHYPEGQYDVICADVVIYSDPRFHGRGSDGKIRPTWKARADCFRVTDQAPISGFFNMGNERQPVVRRGSKFRRVWIMGNGEAPRKRQRMSKRVLIGKVFHVRISDVCKDYEQRTHPDGAIYSTIEEFIACVGP